jgi:hypothetical protein
MSSNGDTCVRAFGHHLGPPNCRSGCAYAVKPCAFGAPLTRLRGLTARHGQTRGIRALMEYLCRLPHLAGDARRNGRRSGRSCPLDRRPE